MCNSRALSAPPAASPDQSIGMCLPCGNARPWSPPNNNSRVSGDCGAWRHNVGLDAAVQRGANAGEVGEALEAVRWQRRRCDHDLEHLRQNASGFASLCPHLTTASLLQVPADDAATSVVHKHPHDVSVQLRLVAVAQQMPESNLRFTRSAPARWRAPPAAARHSCAAWRQMAS